MGGGPFSQLLTLVVMLLAILALPVVLICLYDKFVLEKQRAQASPGNVAPQAPLYVRIAWNLLWFVLLAVVIVVGPRVVFGWARQVAVPLSWLALPVGLWCAIDSWLLAPQRQVRARDAEARDPTLLAGAYVILPVLVLAVIVRMISAESLDFSLVLLLLSVATGVVWAIDHFVLRKRREAAAAALTPPITLREPGTVDYARSFFPVAFIVLIVRSFIFEPFRIPSDSMMPTLLDGDFIVVNKYAYGLRLPVIDRKVVDTGSPQRGDVVVFRFPEDPRINYIKRLVGLPGDRVQVLDDQLVINGQAVTLEPNGRFNDGCYVDMRLSVEKLGEHSHQVMSCNSSFGLRHSRYQDVGGNTTSLPACDRAKIANREGNLVCVEGLVAGQPDTGNTKKDIVVPVGQYLMIGDNRDNSADGREWGFVPDQNVVGRATRIWFNFDLERPLPKVINWGRIGDAIE
jgi:signal peptidase I